MSEIFKQKKDTMQSAVGNEVVVNIDAEFEAVEDPEMAIQTTGKMNLIGMQLSFSSDLNTGDSNRRSKSGSDLPSTHLLNATAIGSVPVDQNMA
ncbi:hypothetical protein L6452_40475 [Arctium lappa]|uniref:Uncharacterized protein n=1 Tax=Arctium lappa TaxID=4217 RepID=A0ACB8XLH2_ARCLA|nr:hypothetical protein L6452_40475 [Arctium lappa]